MDDIMEFTKDLIECVNNDTKELMYDSTGSSGHESTDTIEEMTENDDDDEDDREDEIMQLFLLSAMKGARQGPGKKQSKYGDKRLMKEFMSIYKRNGKAFRNKRKSNKEVQTAYAKIKRHESFNKRRLSWEETKFTEPDHDVSDFRYSEKMFESIMDWAEIFSDWSWNLKEMEDEAETIFADWRWNFEMKEDLRKNFYDDPCVKNQWNEYNYWKMNEDLDKYLELDEGCLADSEDDSNKNWTDCFFWQDGNDNRSIVHDLVDGVIIEDWSECFFWQEGSENRSIIHDLLNDNDNRGYGNYWDESSTNQTIIESLLDENDDDDFTSEIPADTEFIWEERQPMMSLVDFGTYDENENIIDDDTLLWNNPEVLFSLLETNDDDFKEKPDEDVFIWEDQKCLKALLNFEDEEIDRSENVFLWDDENIVHSLVDDDVEGQDLIEFSDDNDDISWQTWPFWSIIGSSKSIIEAYEVCFPNSPLTKENQITNINIDKVFWDICLDDTMSEDCCSWTESANIPKDPINIFKSIRHIFNVPRKKEKKRKNKVIKVDDNHLFDDMEDIYSDWALMTLDDEKFERKRQTRGRNETKKSKSQISRRRPSTPTVGTKQTKYFDLDLSWTEAKKPNNERRTAFARNQKRLHAKMFAKQPRKIM